MVTDGQSESAAQVFKIKIVGQNSGEIHFHSKPIQVREGKSPLQSITTVFRLNNMYNLR